jgi:hypothetical protein
MIFSGHMDKRKPLHSIPIFQNLFELSEVSNRKLKKKFKKRFALSSMPQIRNKLTEKN